MARRIKFVTVLIFLLVSVGAFCLASALGQEKPRHRVNVSVRIVPLFALDQAGEPVFDLKEEELILKVGSETVPLLYLLRRGYQTDLERISEVAKEAKEDAADLLARRSSERINFFIFDSIFNDYYGLRRMKRIAVDILGSARPGEKYVLMGIQYRRGLFLISGPDPVSDELKEKIKSLSFGIPQGDPDEGPDRTEEFAKSIGKMKTAMQMFPQPKVVYLFSQGFSMTRRSIRYLDEVVDVMNRSGVSLFTINPGRNQSFATRGSGSPSLINMAESSGGTFVQNVEETEVVKTIQRSTAAYYELVFQLDEMQKTDQFNLKISCSRQGVRLLTPRTVTRTKVYSEMDKFEKKLYVMDVVERGLMAQMTGDIRSAEVEVVKRTGRRGEKEVTIQLRIPGDMVGRMADIHSLRISREKLDVKNRIMGRELKGVELVSIKAGTGEELHLVVVVRDSRQRLHARIKL